MAHFPRSGTSGSVSRRPKRRGGSEQKKEKTVTGGPWQGVPRWAERQWRGPRHPLRKEGWPSVLPRTPQDATWRKFLSPAWSSAEAWLWSVGSLPPTGAAPRGPPQIPKRPAPRRGGARWEQGTHGHETGGLGGSLWKVGPGARLAVSQQPAAAGGHRRECLNLGGPACCRSWPNRMRSPNLLTSTSPWAATTGVETPATRRLGGGADRERQVAAVSGGPVTRRARALPARPAGVRNVTPGCGCLVGGGGVATLLVCLLHGKIPWRGMGGGAAAVGVGGGRRRHAITSSRAPPSECQVSWWLSHSVSAGRAHPPEPPVEPSWPLQRIDTCGTDPLPCPVTGRCATPRGAERARSRPPAACTPRCARRNQSCQARPLSPTAASLPPSFPAARHSFQRRDTGPKRQQRQQHLTATLVPLFHFFFS